MVFLPRELEKRQDFIRTVIASKVARGVLSSFDESGKVYQRDLVENLPHSNKSILAYLKKLSSFGLIESGTIVYKGKRVVYHQLTKHGWGLARFFFEGLPSDIGELTTFLLDDYLLQMVSLFRERGLEDEVIFDVLARARSRVAFDGSPKYDCPEFILFGAVAYHTTVSCDNLPATGGVGSCRFSSRFPGGLTFKLAIELAKRDRHVRLISSVGNDQDGQNIIRHLIQNNVDVRSILIEDERHTNQTIVLDETNGSRTLVDTSDLATLSLRSPTQVPWDLLKQAKVVYIGEVFVEVAASIAANARVHGIPVVYRVSVPFLELGLDKISPALSQSTVVLLCTHSWLHLEQSEGASAIAGIRGVTDAELVVRDSKGTYKIFGSETKPRYSFPAPKSTNMSEPFVAGLLMSISEGRNLSSALEIGLQMEEEHMKGH